jgi:hypothetical protein
MDQNTFFTSINIAAGSFVLVMLYPILTSKSLQELNDSLKTRPLLAKMVASKSARSYLQACIYFLISFIAYSVIANSGDVEVDMDLAMLSLLILFFITLIRVWKLRSLFRHSAHPSAKNT